MSQPVDIEGIRLFAELARGATTVVYKGYDSSLDRLVLVKLLKEEYRHDRELAAQFEEEARLMARIQHPCVVTVHSYGETEGRAYFVAEFVDGWDLSKVLVDGPLPLELATYVLLEAARGLQAAHEKDVLHRDVKPANILMAGDGTVKVSDFGMALPVAPDRPYGGDIGGTVAYMAPEQIQGQTLTPRVDLFSLGVTFYEMLTGRQAFPGQETSHVLDAVLNDDPLSSLDLDISVPKGLEALCRGMLSKDPEERFQGCRALIENVQTFRAEHGIAASADAMRSYLSGDDHDEENSVGLPFGRESREGQIESRSEQSEREPRSSGPEDRPNTNDDRGPGLLATMTDGGSWSEIINASVLPGSQRVWIYATLGLVLGLLGVFGALSWTPPEASRSDSPPAARSEVGQDDSVVVVDSVESTQVSPPRREPRPETPESRPPEQRESSTVSPDPSPPGRLLISSTPRAVLYVDGDSVGMTPLSRPATADSNPEIIALHHPEFPVYRDTIRIARGDTLWRSVRLADQVGDLDVRIIPWGYVTVGEEPIDTLEQGRKTYVLQAGRHILKASHPIFGTQTDTVEVQAGGTTSVTINLQRPGW